MVAASQNAKSYVVQQALKDGRTRRVTIGRTNVLTLAQATERAKEMLAVFYTGRDPKAVRRGEATLRAALGSISPPQPTSSREAWRTTETSLSGTSRLGLTCSSGTSTRAMVEERLRAIGGGAGNASANGAMRSPPGDLQLRG